jgi:hypothetical protein
MNSVSLVFSSRLHIVIVVLVAAGFWVLMAHFDQLLFFSPVLVFAVPPSGWIGFVLSSTTAGLLGIVVSMNVYIFRTSTVKIGASLFSGSTLGVVSSACAGCTSAGFFITSTFGIAGATATSIFLEFQLPLRVVSLGLLIWACYSAHRRICRSCVLEPNNNMEEH